VANKYTVTLRITVMEADKKEPLVMEESNFIDISFSHMTRVSSDFYDFIAKALKEKT
jgi:hypothetical protein